MSRRRDEDQASAPAGGERRWLDPAPSPAAAELRAALDEAAAREADEVALRRIWAKVADAPAQAAAAVAFGVTRRARWPWLAAATVLGAGAASALLLGTGIDERTGTPRAPAAQTAAIPATAESPRPALVGTVRTGRGETLRLTLRGGTEATVAAESALVLGKGDGPTVSSGEVSFRVPPQAPGRTFTVGAGAYRILVVGTRFRVRVQDDDDHGGAQPGPAGVRIAVEEGTVEVRDAGSNRRLARVGAGASWASPAAAADVGATGAATGPEAPRAPAAASSGGGSPSRRAVVAQGIRRKRRGAATGPLGSPATAELVAARAASRAGDPHRTLSLYRALAQKGGTAGENAEYEIGRVLRDHLRQPREAIAAWRAYRSQHPRGLLRVEADVSVVETLLALGDKDAALAEAAEFVRRHPDSERRAEMARLAGDLQRERGDCRAAMVAYDTAVASGAGAPREIGDGATFFRASCVLRDDPGAGAAALQAYLRAFPGGRFRGEARRLLDAAAGRDR